MNDVFQYEARNAAGRLERGVIAASSEAEALTRLRQRRLTPIGLRKSRGSVASNARISKTAARDLTRTLAQLLNAGVSFAQALKFASEELTGPAGAAAARMHESAEAGAPASQALQDFAGPEALLLRGIVSAGETSGRLVEALEVAAASFDRSSALESRIGGALIYPTFVVVATAATLACFLLVVVPTLGQAFAGSEDKLPDSTRALMQLSAMLADHGVVLFLASVACVGLIGVSPPALEWLQRAIDALITSPIGLGIVRRLEFARFASLASLSLRAGVPAVQAFDSAAAAVRSPSIRQTLVRALSEIRVGERPSQSFERWCDPPRSFLRLAHVGEETGRLGEALGQSSTLLASEAEQRLERLGALAGPLVTLVLGALVAGVVMSLFLGLLAMSELAAT